MTCSSNNNNNNSANCSKKDNSSSSSSSSNTLNNKRVRHASENDESIALEEITEDCGKRRKMQIDHEFKMLKSLVPDVAHKSGISKVSLYK